MSLTGIAESLTPIEGDGGGFDCAALSGDLLADRLRGGAGAGQHTEEGRKLGGSSQGGASSLGKEGAAKPSAMLRNSSTTAMVHRVFSLMEAQLFEVQAKHDHADACYKLECRARRAVEAKYRRLQVPSLSLSLSPSLSLLLLFLSLPSLSLSLVFALLINHTHAAAACRL